jgi:hypothetical protein
MMGLRGREAPRGCWRQDLIHLCNGGPKGRLKILYRLLAALAAIALLVSLAPQLSQIG